MAGQVMRASMATLAALVGPDEQTLIIPVAEARQINTDGTAGVTLIDVTTDELSRLSPYIASIQAFTATEAKSLNMRWKMQFQGSTTGRTYGTVTDLFGYVTLATEVTQPAYTAVDNLGRITRWAIACSPSAGTAVESAIIWCYFAARLRR